ncbi:DNA-directed RNA polymerase II subunit RPB7 [Cryptosporidium andersoni]|uniref:DNA-directed RNA polymerase II subunit RPB7 n=1 Tax=Cryptosporidium andersoni TaxID=117008 RepID=A0A1J4MAW3_9CRYT|nr:DNA-directed RNA polymerase II subunit RPB7 [Cryptosporidium andersoni]
MFGTVSITDKIHVYPNEFLAFSEASLFNKKMNSKCSRSSLHILKERISEKYINKVIKNVGLVISLVEFDYVDHAVIDSDDGSLYFNTTFRIIVFKPFISEIIEGIIINSDSTGLTVSLGFFNDIKIPSNELREPKSMNGDTKLWSWNYETHHLYYLINSIIRFRVTGVLFNDSDTEVSSMVIMGNVQNDGLGMISWWS